MYYRCLAALIVAFWLVMTGLLVRDQFGLSTDRLREVPLTHVLKLLFLHEQRSDLRLYSEMRQIGYFLLQPRVAPKSAQRLLEFSGNVSVAIPGVPHQRVTWDGLMELTPLNGVKRFQIGLNFREPHTYRALLTVEPERHRAFYEASLAGNVIERQEYALDESGARAALARMEVDPVLLQTIQTRSSRVPATIKARQSSWQIQGEKLETYLLTIEQNEQTLLEIQISQLGRVLHVKTLLGYTLSPDEFTP